METLLIKNVQLHNEQKDILIKGNRFERIAEQIDVIANKEIDGSKFAIIPPFYNGHTHAAMSLLRGYADDMPLEPWLNEAIWPMEAKLTADDIYVGSKLAILEMIKSGTVFFNDMYWHEEETIRAVDEMGIRASIGLTFMDRLGEKEIDRLFQLSMNAISGRVFYTIAPHAIYTVSQPLLRRCVEISQRLGLVLHTHLAETEEECDDCYKKYGMTPVRYMKSIGALTSKTMLAHVVHLDCEEMDILAESDAVSVHNPVSNMKMSSGVFKMKDMLEHGCKVIIGTDGNSSNNNLDMMEEIKFAALLSKVISVPNVPTANDIFRMATKDATGYFGIEAGKIAEGRLADALLVDLSNERLVPNHHLISNLVYSADSQCIDTMICDGRILMQGGNVSGEEQILEDVHRNCSDLLKRK